jgi:formylmethanofuran dehydrogenase subunit E
LDDFEYFVNKVNDFHGHICTGIVLGTRMSLAALRYLAVDPHGKKKNLICYAEIDRCMTDAVMIVTGCSAGRRTLKLVDYGKFAMTLINQDTGKAIRVTVNDYHRSEDMEETKRTIMAIPDPRLLSFKDVYVTIPENDLPGFPRKTATCSVCGEQIMDGRDTEHNGAVLCKGCANGTYYRVISK